jgi:uncharacterized protein (DUF488 family)
MCSNESNLTTKVYTLGYAGVTVDELKAVAEALDATIFDVRYSPQSRNPTFRLAHLKKELGDRYHWLRAFGNVNYRNGGEILLEDPSAGMLAVHQSQKPVILMCACRDYDTCHRKTIAEFLTEYAFQVQEIDPKQYKPAHQPTLL